MKIQTWRRENVKPLYVRVHDTVHSYACTTASPVICDPETSTLGHAPGILELFDQSVTVLGGSPRERKERKIYRWISLHLYVVSELLGSNVRRST